MWSSIFSLVTKVRKHVLVCVALLQLKIRTKCRGVFLTSPIIYIVRQEAMENFVFPDEMKTKLKMYEFMNIFLILTGILQKSYKRSFSLDKQLKRPLHFELVWRGKCINQKKLNVKTSYMPYTKRTNQSCYL